MKDFLTLAFLCLPLGVFAQEDENFQPPELAPIVEVLKVSGAIDIDGRLDEADWDGGEGSPIFSDGSLVKVDQSVMRPL